MGRFTVRQGDQVPMLDGSPIDDDTTTLARGAQASTIADPTGGATTDAEARAAINDIIDALEAFGIVASA
jgi:hypothetical protein